MKSLAVRILGSLLVASSPCGFAGDSASIPSPASGAGSTSAIGPRIQFASTVYDFGKIIAGEQVRCEFVFTNTGDERLTVSGVYPGCGCTTASNWSREVEPGQTGMIPLQFDSARFAGPVAKSANIVSNDKQQPSVRLDIKGTIWKPVDVTPQTAVLNTVSDTLSNATTTVSIVSHLEEPITLSDLRSSNPAFVAELSTVEPGKKFQLTVRTVSPLAAGNVQSTISMKTSSAQVPAINVVVIAVVQSVVVVMPPQIVLPPGPLGAAFPASVSVRNNDANRKLSLSEVTVTAEGVGLETKEVEPGRVFMLTATFPAGFQVIPGRGMELVFKTSNPKHPLIKVPIIQNVRNRPQDPQSPQHHRGPVPPPAPQSGATPAAPAEEPGASVWVPPAPVERPPATAASALP